MSFFKAFRSNKTNSNTNYSPLSQSDGSSLPPPATQPANSQTNSSFSARLKRLNPFKTDSIYLEDDSNYVTSEPGYFELSKWDRMLIFALTFAGSVCCYMICIFLFPVLSLKPRKFAILWSLGSIFFLISFGVLQGFKAYMEHLFSSTRLIFTVTFVTSIILTLVSSLTLRSTLLSIIFAAIQLLSVIWYTVSYFPMGTQTLNLAGTVARSQVESWINT
ncbi:Got1/Sft2-like family-domain-containing protein [Scheffersomyces amazonensis]|uniref:Got1/Sft2-like family-domain-containing protein n=1 Tax=Scheffersomyces amazonensis TaxID=1078765 RepID=UPI00315D9E1A